MGTLGHTAKTSRSVCASLFHKTKVLQYTQVIISTIPLSLTPTIVIINPLSLTSDITVLTCAPPTPILQSSPQYNKPPFQLVEVFNVRNTEVETDLLTTLISKVAEEWPPYSGKLAAGVEIPCSPGNEPGNLGELRNKLLHYLEVLQNYKAEQILRSIPPEIPLYHEQAILYCRLEPADYEKSLALYCHVIKDQEKAEEFCRKYYKKDDKIYYKLLKMYQSPPTLELLGFDRFKVEEPRPDMNAAIEVRIKHFKMIDRQQEPELGKHRECDARCRTINNCSNPLLQLIGGRVNCSHNSATLKLLLLQSGPDLVTPNLVTPRFSDRINFPRYRKLTVFDPDLVATPIY
eukprot:sb/3466285/